MHTDSNFEEKSPLNTKSLEKIEINSQSTFSQNSKSLHFEENTKN